MDALPKMEYLMASISMDGGCEWYESLHGLIISLDCYSRHNVYYIYISKLNFKSIVLTPQ